MSFTLKKNDTTKIKIIVTVWETWFLYIEHWVRLNFSFPMGLEHFTEVLSDDTVDTWHSFLLAVNCILQSGADHSK